MPFRAQKTKNSQCLFSKGGAKGSLRALGTKQKIKDPFST